MDLAGPPDVDLVVPAAVDEIAAGRVVRPVWANEVGGATFEVGTGDGRCFVKWSPLDEAWRLDAERPRLEWAAAFTTVPQVLGHGADADGTWLVTTPIDGTNAASDRWRADPATAVRAIGEGLRALHDALPVASCPFDWSAATRVQEARRRAAAGSIDPKGWHEDVRHLDLATALDVVDEPPDVDRLVVCHGDTCPPNTLLDEHGSWVGHVDLGELGVADRWADLAVATWSTTWNYGPSWEGALLDAYGVDPDPVRTAYYRLLWELGP